MSTLDKTFEQICEGLPYLNINTKRLADGSIKTYRRVRIGQGKGVTRIAIKGEWGTKAFVDEYHRAIEELTSGALRSIKDTPVGQREIQAGDPRANLGWLFEKYLASEEFARLAQSTQADKRRRLRPIIEANRFVEWRKLKRSTIKEKLAKVRAAAEGKGKRVSKRAGEEARNQVLKDLSAMFKWLISDSDLLTPAELDDFTNPCAGIKKLTAPNGVQVGQRAWTQAEVDQFIERWPLGTMQYTALQILASFGPRRSDIWRLGRQHLVAAAAGKVWHFKFVTTKTGITIEVPVEEAVAEAIAATTAGELIFLRTSTGRPFKSGNALANWFKKALREAKLPDDLSLHGMRKYCATRYAIHSTELQLQAIFGWADADEARPYIEAANKLRQATVAMKQERNSQLSDVSIANYLKKAS